MCGLVLFAFVYDSEAWAIIRQVGIEVPSGSRPRSLMDEKSQLDFVVFQVAPDQVDTFLAQPLFDGGVLAHVRIPPGPSRDYSIGWTIRFDGSFCTITEDWE